MAVASTKEIDEGGDRPEEEKGTGGDGGIGVEGDGIGVEGVEGDGIGVEGVEGVDGSGVGGAGEGGMAVTTKRVDEDGDRVDERRGIGEAEQVVCENGDVGERSGRCSRINVEDLESDEGVDDSGL